MDRCRHTPSPTRPILQSAAIVVACVVIGGCATHPPGRLSVSDWCWLHYRLAPPGTLASDPGPESVADAVTWNAWLGATVDVPVNRRDPHRTQRRLVDDYIESGDWNDAERESYRASAQSEPTPATICEKVGARIAVADDGSVPSDWNERFFDPNDPAFSVLAHSSELDR